MNDLEFSNRKSVYIRLKKFDYLCSNDLDFIEITEWANTEGYDIVICKNNQTTNLSLSAGEIEAISYLCKTLDYEIQTDSKKE